MAKKNKRLRNLLKKKKKQEIGDKKSIDVRSTKKDTIKKMNGWRIPDKDWEQRVSGSVDKLIKEIKKGYDIGEEETAVLTDNVLKRVSLYQEVAELTGVPLTRGEVSWAIQYEFIYQRNLYKQDTTTEEATRDVNVHNLKYIIEQLYNRYGNPNFEGLKQQVYDETDIESIPLTGDTKELQGVYTTILEREVEKIKGLHEEVQK